jgi:hypothetical protein
MQWLEQADLSDRVRLEVAPLVKHQIGGQTFRWYDLQPLLKSLSESIDLLFIDGPPGKVQALSRYPAFPVLVPHLSHDALIFVEDGGREDEKRMVELWREMEGSSFSTETLDFLPRGPVLLRMRGAERPVARLRRSKARRNQRPQEELEVLSKGRRSGSS